MHCCKRSWITKMMQKECRHLQQSISCGLVKYFTVGEVQEKAVALQSVRLNNILVEFKNKDPDHVEWAKALKEIYVPGLRDYVKKHYPLGLIWSATRVTVSAQAKSSGSSASAPPTTPLASLLTPEFSSRPKQGMSVVFQEISSKAVTVG